MNFLLGWPKLLVSGSFKICGGESSPNVSGTKNGGTVFCFRLFFGVDFPLSRIHTAYISEDSSTLGT